MKFILCAILFLSSLSAFSEVLCSEWKPEITERRSEVDFDTVAYLKALKSLKFYAENKGIDPWPAHIKVQGYLLKQLAISDLESNTKGRGYTNYCNFVVQQGIHHE